jgi:hypothetical protein
LTQPVVKSGVQAVFTHVAGTSGLQKLAPVPHDTEIVSGVLEICPATAALTTAVPLKIEGVNDVEAMPFKPVDVVGLKNVPCADENVTGRPRTDAVGSVTMALTVIGTPQKPTVEPVTVTLGAASAIRPPGRVPKASTTKAIARPIDAMNFGSKRNIGSFLSKFSTTARGIAQIV